MAIPFGFSAADFATGLHLLHKAIVALRDTKGASSHYNYTIVELEGLESLLQKIQGFENFHTSIEHLETLHFLGHQCHIPLAAFLRQIKALEPDLRFGASDKGIRHKYFKRPSRKIDWAIRLQKHVSELKAAIEPQLTTIGILLQLIDIEQQANIVQSHHKLNHTAKEIFSKIENLNHKLDTHLHFMVTTQAQKIPLQSVPIFNGVFEGVNYLNHRRSPLSAMADPYASSTYDNTESTMDTVMDTPIVGIRKERADLSEIKEMLVNQNTLLEQLVRGNNTAGASRNVPQTRSKESPSIEARQTPIGSPSSYPTSPDPDSMIQVILDTARLGLRSVVLKFLLMLRLFQYLYGCFRTIDIALTTSLRDCIQFEDALGRKASLPYEYFRHFPVFIARLQCEFRGLPGEKRIMQNQFHIFDQRSHDRFVTERDWRDSVVAGTKLAMSIVVHRRALDRILCPRCNHTFKTTRISRMCSFCRLTYTFEQEKFFPGSGQPSTIPNRSVYCIPDPLAVTPASHFRLQKTQSSVQDDALEVLSRDDDLHIFKNVHLNEWQCLEVVGDLYHGISSLIQIFKASKISYHAIAATLAWDTSSLEGFVSNLRLAQHDFESALKVLLDTIVSQQERDDMLTDHDNKSWTDAFVSQKFRYVLGDSAYYECYAFAFYLEELLVSNFRNQGAKRAVARPRDEHAEHVQVHQRLTGLGTILNLELRELQRLLKHLCKVIQVLGEQGKKSKFTSCPCT